jgi:hypothetical protein
MQHVANYCKHLACNSAPRCAGPGQSAESTDALRNTLGVDDATWLRGRGWALSTGLNAYTSYAAVNPRVAAQTTRQITEALTG